MLKTYHVEIDGSCRKAPLEAAADVAFDVGTGIGETAAGAKAESTDYKAQAPQSRSSAKPTARLRRPLTEKRKPKAVKQSRPDSPEPESQNRRAEKDGE